MDRLPPFKHSLDSHGHLQTTKHELNKIIKEDIYRQNIQVIRIAPPSGLKPKMAFYANHFMELRDNLIIHPPSMHPHLMDRLEIPLGQFQVGSHQL
jgi:hypothetical protein